MNYASDTRVRVDQSQREIEQLLLKAGAKSFYRGQDGDKAIVGFDLGDRRILFEMPLPKLSGFETTKRNGRTVKVGVAQARGALEQSVRSRWRALMLSIKAKLISVETGVESFEEAFLAQVIVPHDGRAVRFGAIAMKSIADSYKTGKPLPPLLPSGEEG